MKKATVTSVFDRGIKNTTSAFDRSMKRLGIQTDEDVALYESLEPGMFKNLSEKFGEENVLEYIRSMESKRLMNGKPQPMYRR